ncbi:MAG: DUF4142 domain-containing protein, partial [Acidobacteria bacterium]|nr:DUF4142 domain-containing protein [Acidobacteriota bacterium]
MKTTLLLLIVLLLAPGCSREERDVQTSTVGALDTSATSEPVSKEVGRTMIEAEEFAERAIRGGLTEIALAEMAIAASQSAELRSLAQTIRNDHRSANEKLLRILDDTSIEPPEAPSPEQKATIERLSSLSGDQFDREYVQALVESHEKSVEMY